VIAFTMEDFSARESQTVELCMASTRAEYAGRIDEARVLSRQAWERATGFVDACVAAHYVARYELDPVERLRWNEIALKQAEAAPPERVAAWLPSLCVNLGRAHQALGHESDARRYFERASALGLMHDPGGPDRLHSSG
jgi:hypothetical protein